MKICFLLFWVGVSHLWMGVFGNMPIIQYFGISLAGGSLVVALAIAMINYIHGK